MWWSKWTIFLIQISIKFSWLQKRSLPQTTALSNSIRSITPPPPLLWESDGKGTLVSPLLPSGRVLSLHLDSVGESHNCFRGALGKDFSLNRTQEWRTVQAFLVMLFYYRVLILYRSHYTRSVPLLKQSKTANAAFIFALRPYRERWGRICQRKNVDSVHFCKPQLSATEVVSSHSDVFLRSKLSCWYQRPDHPDARVSADGFHEVWIKCALKALSVKTL